MKKPEVVLFCINHSSVLDADGRCPRCGAPERTMPIVNTHMQLQAAAARGFNRQHCLAILQDRGRSSIVYSPFFQTDPDAAWYFNKKKAFFGSGCGRELRASAIAQAKAWIAETYGYDGGWKLNRIRDLVPIEIANRFPIPKRS